jgi:adenylate cyclase
MKTVGWRSLLFALAIAAAVAGVLSLPRVGNVADGIGLDILVALRYALFGSHYRTNDAQVVIVAIDEESYRRDPLADRPIALWTPEIGHLVDALVDAGAAVIGFDVVLPTTIDRLAPGYDREFLRAIHRAGATGRLVLGEIHQQEKPLLPYRGQVIAAGSSNVRPLNLNEDLDGVIRRVPLFLKADPEQVPGFALELAARFLGTPPKAIGGRDVRLGDRTIYAAAEGGLLINFDGGPGGIPRYSFADIVQCVHAGKLDYLQKAFSGKIVILGAVLDVEDRKLTTKRFVTAPDGTNEAPRCLLVPLPGLNRSDLTRSVIPGAEIHASAVRDLITGRALSQVTPLDRFMMVLLATALAAFAGLILSASAAALLVIVALTAFAVLSVVALQKLVVLPTLPVAIAALLSCGLAIAWRSAIVDRKRRALAHAFRLYLPSPAIDRLLSAPRGPELGGELRDVTVLFSDIANFTTIAERQDAAALVTALNLYFDHMAEIIEREGGFIDKFIGDAIVAVFGAPVGPSDHAAAAVRAARAMAANTPQLSFSTRIGVNSGRVLIGNIGAKRRFNYTVIGDTVNLASRLEGANKLYGTNILLSGDTRAAISDIVVREIDCVRVVGRADPVVIFTPIDTHDQTSEAQYAAALNLYRNGDFKAAADKFTALKGDAVAAVMAIRASSLAETPPASWDGATPLSVK